MLNINKNLIPLTIIDMTTKVDTNTFEYFVNELKRNLHPILDEQQEQLLNSSEVINFMKQCWYEAKDIGYNQGYDDGFDNGLDDYYRGSDDE